MKKVIIVHGYTGHPEKNWFPWLKAELNKLGVEVLVPAMPNPGAPQLSEWLPYLQQQVGTPTEDTYFVGHSLGCPTILRFVESLPEGQKVGGAVLVAGFAEPLPRFAFLDGFTTDTWDDQKIRSHIPTLTIMNSDDDPAVPFDRGEHIRDRFDAKLVALHNMGHINEKANIKEVPFVLDELKVMMSL